MSTKVLARLGWPFAKVLVVGSRRSPYGPPLARRLLRLRQVTTGGLRDLTAERWDETQPDAHLEM